MATKKFKPTSPGRRGMTISAFTEGKRFKPSITALTKNDMKPSFTPCFFSKLSL